jgi:hypothetical protein
MSDPRQSVRSFAQDAGWLVAIGLTGVVLRLVYVWQYTEQPLGHFPWVDESSYWSWAQAIWRGGWWPVRPFYQDPLYPYWLACLMGVVGSDVAGLRMASAGLGALTPLVVFWVGRTGLGRSEGLLAGWATALYGPLIFADGSLEKEGLAAFCTALAMGLTACMSNSGRPALAGTAGAAWGVVGLLRSNALLIAPIAASWLLFGTSDRPRPDPKRRLRLSLTYLAGFFLVILPVAAVNTAVSNPRELLGTTWQLGPNFYIGNGPGATGTYMAPPFVRAHPAYEAADYAVESMRLTGRPLSLGEVSRFWLGQGVRQWVAAPLASIRLFFWKLALLTHRFEIPDSQDIEFVRIVAAPALALGVVDFGVVFPLAIIGLARVPRTDFWWFLNLATWLGLAATALFFVVGRYRVPWVPGLILLASAGTIDLWRRIQNGDWKGLAWRVGVLGVPAAFLCWHSQADPVPTRWGNQLLALGVADLRGGEIDDAIESLDLARASSPAMATRLRDLSNDAALHDLLRDVINRELGKTSNAARGIRGTIRQVRLLRQLNEHSALARSLLETALRTHSDDATVQREWGALLLFSSERPADRSLSLEPLELAARGPGADTRATIILALATGDPKVLDRLAVAQEDKLFRFATLVRAILASRSGERASAVPANLPGR